MLNISYDIWQTVCDMYFNLKIGRKRAYLQWYPYSKFLHKEQEQIRSSSFFEKYINSGTFVLFDKIMFRTENYLQKNDASFRDSYLISPILFLILQAIGKKINNHYINQRSANINVYYAGNFEENRAYYKQDYDTFFKTLNAQKDNYNYFIKTDIREFYGNIDINKLLTRIDTICNAQTTVFTQTQLLIYKELFLFCGNGKFPFVENSLASSYLSTIVYLDTVDNYLYEYVATHIFEPAYFTMVRYVDDLYILIATNKTSEEIHKSFNDIRNAYSSKLKEIGLILNTQKCCVREISKLNEELKKSLYYEHFTGEKCDLFKHEEGTLINFIESLNSEVKKTLTLAKYNEIINKTFSIQNVEFTPHEVFNRFIYENDSLLTHTKLIDVISKLVKNDLAFICLDPKRLTLLLVKTCNGKIIRDFLNYLFKRNKQNKWNFYDTTIAINYLIQRNFQHTDLLKAVKKNCPNLYKYYVNFCKTQASLNFLQNSLCDRIKEDPTACCLYLLFLAEKNRENVLTSFSYFKNFFDRCTADIDFFINTIDKPNYNKFYKEGALKSFYKNIPNSSKIISAAHKLRNASPVAHSSAELLNKEGTKNEIIKCINDLNYILTEYLKK